MYWYSFVCIFSVFYKAEKVFSSVWKYIFIYCEILFPYNMKKLFQQEQNM